MERLLNRPEHPLKTNSMLSGLHQHPPTDQTIQLRNTCIHKKIVSIPQLKSLSVNLTSPTNQPSDHDHHHPYPASYSRAPVGVVGATTPSAPIQLEAINVPPFLDSIFQFVSIEEHVGQAVPRMRERCPLSRRHAC